MLHECALCNATDISCCVNHLFEVPQRSTAVHPGYCKPAGRCCRTWGHQHLSLSPVSPKYLKSTGTWTRQTSGGSLHAPKPRLASRMFGEAFLLLSQNITWLQPAGIKKLTLVSAGTADLQQHCSLISPHFSIVVQKYSLSTDFFFFIMEILHFPTSPTSVALTLMEANPSDNLKLKKKKLVAKINKKPTTARRNQITSLMLDTTKLSKQAELILFAEVTDGLQMWTNWWNSAFHIFTSSQLLPVCGDQLCATLTHRWEEAWS